MKKIFKHIPVLAMMIAFIAGSALSVSALPHDFTNVDYHCYFTKDHKMETNFTAKDLGRIIEDLQPGDDVTFKVTYQNQAKETTEWYMLNEVEQTLEKTKAAKKVSGTGTPEEGGYTYELTNYRNDGSAEVLFNSTEQVIGGRDKPENGREGLEEATNALEDWFHIQTLKSGQGGYLILKIAFEGETEVNDYMDTDGIVNMQFAVELEEPEGTPPSKRVNTGDNTQIMVWVSILMAAGVLLLILAVVSRKRDKKEVYNEKH